MIKVKCNCGTEMTVLSTDGEEVVVQHCDPCSVYAYALGFIDGGVPNAEKTEYATIMADRRTIKV